MTTNGVTQTKFVKWLALSLVSNQNTNQYMEAVLRKGDGFFLLSLLHNENISTYNDTRPDRFRQNAFCRALADRLDTEIISADSRQIYRGMDIGTGKDLADYTVNGKAIPYHLIDICDPGYKYNVFEYQHDFFRAYQAVQEKGKLPILCGGTGSISKRY